MLHKNTVFHGLLKHVPWPAFDRLVEHHRADAGVRRLPTKSQFVALLYGQLAGASSLREIVAGVRSHAARLYHLGARPVQRSTLADANAHRPAAVFTELFALMIGQANRHLRRALGDTVCLIDSTADHSTVCSTPNRQQFSTPLKWCSNGAHLNRTAVGLTRPSTSALEGRRQKT